MPKKKTVSDTKSLTLLGQKQTKAMKQLETFKCPNNIQKVIFETDEVTSNCPKTGQPDFYKEKRVASR